MRRLLGILFSLSLSLSSFCQTKEIDSLLRVLDTSIQERTKYTSARQSEINSLQKKLRLVHTDKEQFDVYKELFGKYLSLIHISEPTRP